MSGFETAKVLETKMELVNREAVMVAERRVAKLGRPKAASVEFTCFTLRLL